MEAAGRYAWLFALAISGAANANTYDAVADFSATANPGTVWSYLYTDSLQTTPSLLTTMLTVAPGVNDWWTGGTVPDSVIVGRNSSGSPYTSSTAVYPVNELAMDPESGSAIVQFTAPAAGTYAISGEFTGIDTHGNSHPVEILDNGTQIFKGTISTYGMSDTFSLTETLKAGGVIDFEVLTGSPSSSCSYCYLSTGLAATLTSTSVTEPGTLGLMGVALAGLALKRRWRKN
jgi:hypothetical protein